MVSARTWYHCFHICVYSINSAFATSTDYTALILRIAGPVLGLNALGRLIPGTFKCQKISNHTRDYLANRKERPEERPDERDTHTPKATTTPTIAVISSDYSIHVRSSAAMGRLALHRLGP